MNIIINKSVPIPPFRARNAKYPFTKMEVGDSFELPKAKAQSVRTSAGQFANRANPKQAFTVRTTGDTCRIWRIQ